jgi:hypothetical protein
MLYSIPEEMIIEEIMMEEMLLMDEMDRIEKKRNKSIFAQILTQIDRILNAAICPCKLV